MILRHDSPLLTRSYSVEVGDALTKAEYAATARALAVLAETADPRGRPPLTEEAIQASASWVTREAS